MPAGPDKKYKSILSKEQSFAKALALSVVKAKPISVWEVTIPVIFIFGFMRLKSSREIFTQNFMFTKKLALDAAFDMIKKGQSREEVMSHIQGKTSGLLASVKQGVYSEEIRRMQLKEIDLLIEHYCRLLGAEGKDYASLVIDAYKSERDYLAFLGQLKNAEQEVTLAARQTLGARADHEMASQIEESTDRARMADVGRIFGSARGSERGKRTR